MSAASPIRPMGDRALLLELEDNEQARRVAAAARERLGTALQDIVPGHRTVLLVWPAPPVDASAARALAGLGPQEPSGRAVTAGARIAVVYDGPDLHAVAGHAGASPEEVIRRHAAGAYRVAFVGFAPGFAYLLGSDPSLHVERRDEPRERVPAGAVALAGPYTAVYPSASPGGWQLIGRTDAALWVPDRSPPALLDAGMAVTFVPIAA